MLVERSPTPEPIFPGLPDHRYSELGAIWLRRRLPSGELPDNAQAGVLRQHGVF